MKKVLFTALSLAAAISLNATVYATVNGKDVTEKELAPLLQGIGNVDIAALNADQKKELIDKGIDEIVKDNLALRVWQAKEASKINIDDKEIADFYNKNKARFTEPARIKAAQIVVKTEAEANDIIKQLKGLSDSALFTKFAELAKAKSIDPQAKQTGGELGWMPSDQVKPFADAISKIKDGQITTKAIKSRVGYHVVLKEESQAKKQLSQSEAKPFIERVLRQQKAAKVVEQKAADLHKSAKIEYK